MTGRVRWKPLLTMIAATLASAGPDVRVAAAPPSLPGMPVLTLKIVDLGEQKPLKGVTVQVMTAPGPFMLAEGITDADGVFAKPIPAGQIAVRYSKTGWLRDPETASFAHGPQPTSRVLDLVRVDGDSAYYRSVGFAINARVDIVAKTDPLAANPILSAEWKRALALPDAARWTVAGQILARTREPNHFTVLPDIALEQERLFEVFKKKTIGPI